jgi:hypothetical protein
VEENDFIDKIREEFDRVAMEFRSGIEEGLMDGSSYIVHGKSGAGWILAEFRGSSMGPLRSICIEYAYVCQGVSKVYISNPIDFGELDSVLESFVKIGPGVYLSHFRKAIGFFLSINILPDDINNFISSMMVSEVMRS